jgi:hypothetical protein
MSRQSIWIDIDWCDYSCKFNSLLSCPTGVAEKILHLFLIINLKVTNSHNHKLPVTTVHRKQFPFRHRDAPFQEFCANYENFGSLRVLEGLAFEVWNSRWEDSIIRKSGLSRLLPSGLANQLSCLTCSRWVNMRKPWSLGQHVKWTNQVLWSQCVAPVNNQHLPECKEESAKEHL